jgi:MFS family permease
VSSTTFERRLVVSMSAVVFLDTLFYAVIAPLLPTLVHELHLTKAAAGLLTASYPIGTLAGSLPGGLLAARAGPRATVLAGLTLLTVSTTAFAFLASSALLDAARFVEGVGGACSWAGAIAWVSAEGSPSRRGALIGSVLAGAIGGAVFGPVLGVLASAAGRATVFSLVGGAAAVLMLIAARLPSAHVPGIRSSAAALRRALGDRSLTLGAWLVAVPAGVSGIITVLAPLRLHALGAGAPAIGATFLIAAAGEALVSRPVGALSDRRGRRTPLRFGLATTACLLVLLGLSDGEIVFAGLVVLASAALGAFWAPAMAMISDAAERISLDHGLGAALMNAAWAAGQMLGAGAGGALAGVGGDRLPIALGAAVCAGSLALIARPSRRARGAARRMPG